VLKFYIIHTLLGLYSVLYNSMRMAPRCRRT